MNDFRKNGHLALGRRAEELALAHIEKKGWQVLARNFACRLGELDIVALDEVGGELIVIEVRCRTCGEMQSPVDSVGPKKLRSLVAAGRIFVQKNGWEGPWRIDLIGIVALQREPEACWPIEYIEDITGGNFPF